MKMEFEYEAPNEAAGILLQELLRRRRWVINVGMETITLMPWLSGPAGDGLPAEAGTPNEGRGR